MFVLESESGLRKSRFMLSGVRGDMTEEDFSSGTSSDVNKKRWSQETGQRGFLCFTSL